MQPARLEGTDPASAALLRVEQLSYRYPDGVEALQEVSFSIGSDERIGLVGPSGAGKSTLLLHLNGLLPERIPPGLNGAAAIHVAGLPLAAGNLAEIRRLVGLVFQDPDDQLFCPSVEEDVAFGPLNLGLRAGEIRQRVSESLAAVDMSGSEKRSPLRLSVGERKRVCLAGVLACRPQLLVLDEPSANLDPRSRRHLLELLDRTGGAQLIASHDLNLVAEHCRRVLVLDEGRLKADGAVDEILSDAPLMERHGLEVPWRLR